MTKIKHQICCLFHIITKAPVLDAPPGRLTYKTGRLAYQTYITYFRSSTVPSFENTNFEPLFLIFLIILFASINSLTVWLLFMLRVKCSMLNKMPSLDLACMPIGLATD